jgi:hypothetical protein
LRLIGHRWFGGGILTGYAALRQRGCLLEEDFFFSEEKKQKTFTSLSRFSPARVNQDIKVFWFFFSKKNFFPIFLCLHTGREIF